MWMMGCHDDPDSFNCARKLRPLIPRPAAPPPPSITRIHAPDHFFLAAMAEQNKRDGASSVVVSSRWNPTPEQLRTLEELYRRGTRTPSADQIQHITAQLRRYGKIEGKNVFYWFQNHKARERQKRRRQMECPQDVDHKDKSSSSSSPGGGGGSSTRVAGLEAEQNKNTNTTTPLEQEEEQVRGTRAGTAMAEACTTRDGWVQYDHRELQHQQIIMTRNATWRSMMQLPCPLPAARVTPTPPTVTLPSKRLNVKDQDYLNIFFTHHHNTVDFADDHDHDHDHTLELFPLCSENAPAGHDNNKLTTPNYQFFEFLPLKNS